MNIPSLNLKETATWLKTLTVPQLLLIFAPLTFLIIFLFLPIREVLTPFIFAAVVAYLLTPLVEFLTEKAHLPRIISIVGIFFIFIILLSVTLTQVIALVNGEVRQLSEESRSVSLYIKTLPGWAQGPAIYLAASFQNTSTLKQFFTLPFLENTASRVISLFAFFVALFYFLKDSTRIGRRVPQTGLTRTINETLQNYVRGQAILVIVMTLVTWIFLSVLGIKFAFILSLFTGFAELIPYVGPITAGGAAVIVTFLTGSPFFQESALLGVLVVAAGYFLLRQLEDFLVVPHVVGRSVKLHPLIILFTTLFAGKLFGFIGLLLGVPFVATYKVIVEAFLKKEAAFFNKHP
ncbi:AI-2E family transporter [Candidatus Roizmanbacteria bacterium]|nr:AI-2E family transporter [Candidatus Roizmanbacteria bacterium]